MGCRPVSLYPKLSLTSIVMEKKANVNTSNFSTGALEELPFSCDKRSRFLYRHGGLIRHDDAVIRIRKGPYRCPLQQVAPPSCSPKGADHLPLWHDDVNQYLLLVGTHGLPEEDRPQRCPIGCTCTRLPHRHSHYVRTVITPDGHIKICIFRFRCPDCRYVHSVIPAFLEPYQALTLDLQEELVEAMEQGATVASLAESTESLPSGALDEQTLERLIHGWKKRLMQIQSGLWVWIFSRIPHTTLPRSTSLWDQLRSGCQTVRAKIPIFRDIRFLHGLNRLCFFMAVTEPR